MPIKATRVSENSEEYDIKIPYTSPDKDIDGNDVTLIKMEKITLNDLNEKIKRCNEQIANLEEIKARTQEKIEAINTI